MKKMFKEIRKKSLVEMYPTTLKSLTQPGFNSAQFENQFIYLGTTYKEIVKITYV